MDGSFASLFRITAEKKLIPKGVSDQSLVDMEFSENSGTPKSSILIGYSIVNHPFWGTPIFGNTHMVNDDPTAFS